MKMYGTFHPNVLQEMHHLEGCVVLFAGTLSKETAEALVHLDAQLQEFKTQVCLVNVSGLGSVVALVKDGATERYFQSPHFEHQSTETL